MSRAHVGYLRVFVRHLHHRTSSPLRFQSCSCSFICTSHVQATRSRSFCRDGSVEGHVSIFRSSTQRVDNGDNYKKLRFCEHYRNCPATYATLLQSCVKGKLCTLGMLLLHHHLVPDHIGYTFREKSCYD